MAESEGLMPQDLDQCQAGVGRGQGILWLQPVVAVYGPEQSLVGSDAQASRLSAWARWSDAESALDLKCVTYTRRTTVRVCPIETPEGP